MIGPEFIVVDLFCGAGGTTTGFDMANGIAKVIACVNHDKKAIKSHWLNHPDVKHFEEDIRTLDLTELINLVIHYRKLYPNTKLILWASLECTNFSKAKGGLPRDADSRTLADFLLRYVHALNPDIIQIENVVEFMSWGPLDNNGKPVSRQNGKEWVRWRKEICELGYADEWRTLNAADFGAYTSRNRLFGMFAKEKNMIFWPEPTHCKNPSKGEMFSAPEKWKAVKHVLDFEDEGTSIFDRKKELSPKTLARIYAGLLKYVADGEKEFIAKYFSGRPEGKVISVNGPAGTITTKDGQSIIQTKFLMNYHHSSDVNSIENPSPTLVTKDKLAIVNSCFLAKYHGNGSNINSIDNPASTLSTKDRLAKIQPVWIDRNFNNGGGHQSVDSPAGSILSVPKLNLVQTEFILNKNSSTAPSVSVDNPSPTITQRTHYLVNTKFIMNSNFNNVGSSIEDPAPTVTASRKHHYIINPSWFGNNGSVDNPCCTIVARQDKAPLYLIAAEIGNIALPVYETDSEIMIKIKEFMVAFGIVDIKMRMLKVLELLKIQGFPEDYKLFGNQTDQKKFIGNSVCPDVVKCWIISINENLLKMAA